MAARPRSARGIGSILYNCIGEVGQRYSKKQSSQEDVGRSLQDSSLSHHRRNWQSNDLTKQADHNLREYKTQAMGGCNGEFHPPPPWSEGRIRLVREKGQRTMSRLCETTKFPRLPYGSCSRLFFYGPPRLVAHDLDS